jgi:hypothetical protein
LICPTVGDTVTGLKKVALGILSVKRAAAVLRSCVCCVCIRLISSRYTSSFVIYLESRGPRKSYGIRLTKSEVKKSFRPSIRDSIRFIGSLDSGSIIYHILVALKLSNDAQTYP